MIWSYENSEETLGPHDAFDDEAFERARLEAHVRNSMRDECARERGPVSRALGWLVEAAFARKDGK